MIDITLLSILFTFVGGFAAGAAWYRWQAVKIVTKIQNDMWIEYFGEKGDGDE